jgi:hypothetical protein
MSKWAVWTAGTMAVAVACGVAGPITASAATRPTAHAVALHAGAADQASGRWTARLVLRQPGTLGIVGQVIDGRTRTDFALSSLGQGTAFQLHRIPLGGGHAVTGPVFKVSQIALGSGSVWVFGARAASPSKVSLLLYQVNPVTLAITRFRQLAPPRQIGGFVGFTAARNGTVWVGFLRTILHISAKTGKVIGHIRTGPGTTVTSLSIDPAGTHLYVTENTRLGTGVVAEYAAKTGRRLAINTRSPFRFTVGGGSATAVPGGVWVSFRTGSLGQTILLRQRGLRLVKLPGFGRPGSLFNWVMFGNTELAGHALYLARVDGKIGCMVPGTGRILARGVISKLAGGGDLVGSANAGRVIYAVGRAGVLAITPPTACQR